MFKAAPQLEAKKQSAFSRAPRHRREPRSPFAPLETPLRDIPTPQRRRKSVRGGASDAARKGEKPARDALSGRGARGAARATLSARLSGTATASGSPRASESTPVAPRSVREDGNSPIPRNAPARVRAVDGVVDDPWRLRSSSLPMRGPAKLMLRLRGPSRSRVTPVLLGGFRAREAIFEIAAVVPLFGLDDREWSWGDPLGPFEVRKTTRMSSRKGQFEAGKTYRDRKATSLNPVDSCARPPRAAETRRGPRATTR